MSENLRYWDAVADQWEEAGELQWASEPNWGQWRIAETDLALFPPLDGVDAIELGCGTGFVSAWMWRRGGRLVFLSSTPLATLCMPTSGTTPAELEHLWKLAV